MLWVEHSLKVWEGRRFKDILTRDDSVCQLISQAQICMTVPARTDMSIIFVP